MTHPDEAGQRSGAVVYGYPLTGAAWTTPEEEDTTTFP
jgi:hypothetical protein